MPRLDESFIIFVKRDIEHFKFYYLDKILNKRDIKKGRGYVIKYFVKWKKYDSKHDRWMNIKKLENVKKFVKNYEKANRQDSRNSQSQFITL